MMVLYSIIFIQILPNRADPFAMKIAPGIGKALSTEILFCASFMAPSQRQTVLLPIWLASAAWNSNVGAFSAKNNF